MQNKILINIVEFADRNVHLTSLYIHSSESQRAEQEKTYTRHSTSVNIIALFKMIH